MRYSIDIIITTMTPMNKQITTAAAKQGYEWRKQKSKNHCLAKGADYKQQESRQISNGWKKN